MDFAYFFSKQTEEKEMSISKIKVKQLHKPYDRNPLAYSCVGNFFLRRMKKKSFVTIFPYKMCMKTTGPLVPLSSLSTEVDLSPASISFAQQETQQQLLVSIV